MAEEIGALRAVLALEAAAFDRGVASARRQLSLLEGGLSKTGGQVAQFGQRMSRDAAAGFSSLSRSAGASRAAMQNFGYQVQDVAVQITAGTSAVRALSMQLPQLLSGFGPVGTAIATVVAVASSLWAVFGRGSSEASRLSSELKNMQGSVSAVEGAISAVKSVQEQYLAAINAQGGASSAAAALVVSNSEREFNARKRILEQELVLLRIRNSESAAQARNISDQIAGEANSVLDGIQGARNRAAAGR